MSMVCASGGFRKLEEHTVNIKLRDVNALECEEVKKWRLIEDIDFRLIQNDKNKIMKIIIR